MEIEKSIYEGYIWYSDQAEPKVLNNEEFELKIDDDENPFIIEGQLYSPNKRLSISIKYIDGQYIIKEKEIKSGDFNSVNVQIKEFHSNRMNGKKLRFLQYWEEREDYLCASMKVLQPTEFIFVGFVND